MVWYYHLFKNFPQFVVIHTVKGSKGSGGRLICKILVKGEFNETKRLLYTRLSASHEELMSP